MWTTFINHSKATGILCHCFWSSAKAKVNLKTIRIFFVGKISNKPRSELNWILTLWYCLVEQGKFDHKVKKDSAVKERQIISSHKKIHDSRAFEPKSGRMTLHHLTKWNPHFCLIQYISWILQELGSISARVLRDAAQKKEGIFWEFFPKGGGSFQIPKLL